VAHNLANRPAVCYILITPCAINQALPASRYPNYFKVYLSAKRRLSLGWQKLGDEIHDYEQK
jgi:hypothetical protein